MKALIIERFGNPSAFKEANLMTPDILPDRVLIQVAATSVNPLGNFYGIQTERIKFDAESTRFQPTFEPFSTVRDLQIARPMLPIH